MSFLANYCDRQQGAVSLPKYSIKYQTGPLFYFWNTFDVKEVLAF